MTKLICLLFFALSAFAQSPDEREITGTVQSLFDAMAKRDATAVRLLFIPAAPVIAIRSSGKVTTSTSEEFATRLAASTESWTVSGKSPV